MRLDARQAAAAALLLIAGWLGSGLASAPAGAIGGHARPASARPLHTRLGLAEAALVARGEGVAPGRLQLRAERGLLGVTPERFEVKRSPAQPPPLETGDRALVLLRGARSPYLLVDEPHETIRLDDSALAEHWSDAVRSLASVIDRPDRWVALYTGWIEQGPDALRQLGIRGLLDPDAEFQPLAPTALDERLQVALDPAAASELRRASALLVVRDPVSADRMLRAVPIGNAPSDTIVALVALQGAVIHRNPALPDALARALQHADPELRLGALSAAPNLRADRLAKLLPTLSSLAAEDPDPRVRARATQTLQRAAPAEPGWN